MASGQAKVLHAATGKRVRILDRERSARWHPIWEGLPYIVRPGEAGDFAKVVNGPGVRPYIEAKTRERWTWRQWPQGHPPRGEIRLTQSERAFGERFAGRVIIEPTLKHRASPNKDWGRARWVELTRLLLEASIVPAQLGADRGQCLPGVEWIETYSFREACAVLAHARAAVLPEGGLHHAAAALNVPAVVIFGGFIGPSQTGYASQVNLFSALNCGMRVPCEHCAQAMAAITPERVQRALLDLIEAIPCPAQAAA